MARGTDVNLLTKKVMEYLENYAEDIEEQVIKISNEVANEAKEKLKTDSPHGKGKRKKTYSKGWRIKKDKLGGKIYKVKIYNATNYQLTHLLEFGHATRNRWTYKSNSTYSSN